MDQPDGIRILAGMAGKASADVNMPEGEATAELVVPVSAVLASEEPDKSYLWVIDESAKTVSLRPVVARRLTDRGIIVEQGIEPGEWIATAGVHFLKEGQQVEILAEGSSAP
jgi:multidrug efflux pump subunit AcrA (membrane-fusion protein)